MKKVPFVIAALFLLSACVSQSAYDASGKPQPWFTAEEAAAITKASSSAAEGRKFLAGTTAWVLSDGYGTQIEYLAPDGTSDLWFPGNKATVPGQWKVVESSSGDPVMCFLYGASSYDVISKRPGGAWECAPLTGYLMHLEGLVTGDPFRLAHGKVPYASPKGALFTLEQAQENGGQAVSQGALNYKFNRLKPSAAQK